MPIALGCPKCSKKLKLADTLAGKAVKCPQCATVLRVPGTAAAAVKPAPAAPPPAKAAAAFAADENVKPAAGVPRRAPVASPDDDNVKAAPAVARTTPEEADVPEELRERVREELTKGERIVWLGRPDPKLVLLKNLALSSIAVLVLLVMTGSGVRRMAAGPRDRNGGAALAGIGLLGCAVAVAVPFFQRWKATKSCYALTSRRAIVLDRNAIGIPQMTNYNPADLAGMRRREWWFFQEAGDVIFRTKVTITVTDHYARGGRGRGFGGPGGYMGSSVRKSVTHYGFLAVRRPRQVEALIRETLVDPILDKLNA
jgi:hypothetical protein